MFNNQLTNVVHDSGILHRSKRRLYATLFCFITPLVFSAFAVSIVCTHDLPEHRIIPLISEFSIGTVRYALFILVTQLLLIAIYCILQRWEQEVHYVLQINQLCNNYHLAQTSAHHKYYHHSNIILSLSSPQAPSPPPPPPHHYVTPQHAINTLASRTKYTGVFAGTVLFLISIFEMYTFYKLHVLLTGTLFIILFMHVLYLCYTSLALCSLYNHYAIKQGHMLWWSKWIFVWMIILGVFNPVMPIIIACAFQFDRFDVSVGSQAATAAAQVSKNISSSNSSSSNNSVVSFGYGLVNYIAVSSMNETLVRDWMAVSEYTMLFCTVMIYLSFAFKNNP